MIANSLVQTATTVANIASSCETREARAEQLLAELERVVPFVASHILLTKEFEMGHDELFCVGYDEETSARLSSASFHREIEQLGMLNGPRALRMKDVPDGPSSVEAVTEVLYPAGFAEGMTATLHSGSGRYVGMLNMSTVDARHPSDEARDLIEWVSTAIAHAVDPVADLIRGLMPECDAQAMALVTAGGLKTVGGLPLGILENQDLAEAAARRLHGGRGRWVTQTDDGQWHRIIALRTAQSNEPSVLVTAAGEVDVLGLTRREIEVLNLIIVGYQNPEIADKLSIGRRTVATHIESILNKLGLPNRAAAASVALRYGLELI